MVQVLHHLIMEQQEKEQMHIMGDQDMVEDISIDDHQTTRMGHMGGMFLRGISTIMVMDHKVMDQEGILMGIPQIIFLGDQAKDPVPLQDLILEVNWETRPEVKDMEGQVSSNQKIYKQ